MTTLRWTIPLLAMACSQDYGFSDACIAEGDYATCPTEGTWRESQRRCELLGGAILEVDTLYEQQLVSHLGPQLTGWDLWWGGHRPDASTECTAMDLNGGSAQADCDLELPVVCELPVDPPPPPVLVRAED